MLACSSSLAQTLQERMQELEKLMHQAAEQFEFEKAIELRDEWLELQKQATK